MIKLFKTDRCRWSDVIVLLRIRLCSCESAGQQLELSPIEHSAGPPKWWTPWLLLLLQLPNLWFQVLYAATDAHVLLRLEAAMRKEKAGYNCYDSYSMIIYDKY